MPDHPNVIFLLADNLGYGDVGCYGCGGEIRGMPTPNIDRLATEGVRLDQFMVEAACTPSRAACLTGRYSIRCGVSLISVPGSNEILPNEFSLGDLFTQAGYDTVYYGKWHLGASTETEPQYHGFDEWRFGFYGSSDGTLAGDNMSRFHAPSGLREHNLIDVRQSHAPRTPSEILWPYDLEYRRKIDNEMTADAAAYIRSHANSEKPFFQFLGLTRSHFPNLPSDEFKGASRIGNYGDCVMELDYNVGVIMDAVRDAGIDDNTIIVFCSDNGPTTTATIPEEIHMGSAGPFRGELGDPTEGSIRTVGMVRWPGHFAPLEAGGMFSIMDFLPTLAAVIGQDLPTDKPIDGIDQTSYLDGTSATSMRESLLTFVGDRLMAVRWNQWRLYTVNTFLTDGNPRLGGYQGYMNETNGYPMGFNIEADQGEQRNVLHENGWLLEPYLLAIHNYKSTLEEHPNPPAANLTRF